MNRRRFLSLLGAGAAGMAFDPERLLWVPGQTTIFDLGARQVSGLTVRPDEVRSYLNSFHTSDWIAREALKILSNQLISCNQLIMARVVT